MGRCRLQRLTEAQAAEIAALVGVRVRGDSVTIDLLQFQQIVVGTGRFSSLEALVRASAERDIIDRRQTRDAQRLAWREVVDQVGAEMKADDPARREVERLHESGGLFRLSQGDPAVASTLLQQALSLLAALPVPPTPLAVFAADRLGDAHALDLARPLARLMIRLLAARSEQGAPTSASERRRLLEQAGLATDELSSTALALNLPAVGQGITDRMLRDHAAAGLPCRLTLRHLRLAPPTFATVGTPQPVFVCENPSVLAAAADALAAACPPLVCVEGNPSLACQMLLELLVRGGYEIQYHGDFDWGGLRIANRIFAAFGFRPWRYTAPDYQLAGGSNRPLKPPPADAAWDPDLRAAIIRGGQGVDEESLIDVLLNDLRGQ